MSGLRVGVTETDPHHHKYAFCGVGMNNRMEKTMAYKLSEKGLDSFRRMRAMHEAEIAKQEAEVGAENTEYGWSCIDDYDHIHNIDDEIDLLIYAYGEHVIDTIVDWAQHDKDIYGKWSMDSDFSFGYSYKEVISMISMKGLLEVVK